ncbi:general transcription factor II-I repeat domain-containing protein 2-like [Hyperolius riggenbachi]|uniref:general transcription factor II-I repeat domain-containing protein 2-like n=1 Tax=Hyperolius riggenbachi TaxID=752182 RepID=UPI0035A28AF6
MSVRKKLKVHLECRNFQEKWTNLYFFVQHEDKPLCLICKYTASVFKEYNVKRHYETKHKAKYDEYVGLHREQKIAKLREELGGIPKMFNQKRKENEAAVRASFRVAHILSREAKPFSEGECVKRCILAVVEELCPEKKSEIEAVSLSRMTITRRVEDLGSDLQLQLKKKASQFVMFSIAADESTDVSDTAQLLVFIRGVTPMFEITEELAAMKSMHGTTTGEDLFREVSEVINDLALDWSKLVGVTTDGAKSMVGRHNGLVARVSQKVIESNGSRPLGLHCIIHQQNLCGKQLNLEHVMKVVVHSVNFIRSHALNHRTFRKLLDEMESEHEDVIYHSEVRWLSRGRVLKRFFELRHEINIFMTGKSKQLPELGDPSWLWDLAILCDLTEYLNELNVKLQGKNKLICHVYADISAFKTKLQLFIEQAEQEILVHFPTCAALRQEQSSPFPRRKMIQLLKLLN